MSELSAGELRLASIREAVMLAGRWSEAVERAVRDALGEAFDAGVEAGARTDVRLLRWIEIHAGEETTQRAIGEAIGVHRETACRHLSALARRGLIEHLGWSRGYRLTGAGRAELAGIGSGGSETGPRLPLTDDAAGESTSA